MSDTLVTLVTEIESHLDGITFAVRLCAVILGGIVGVLLATRND